jgi:hypothetical protein
VPFTHQPSNKWILKQLFLSKKKDFPERNNTNEKRVQIALMITGKNERTLFRNVLFADNMTRKPDKPKNMKKEISDPVDHNFLAQETSSSARKNIHPSVFRLTT